MPRPPPQQPDPRIDQVLTFWFSLPPSSWFSTVSNSNPTLDSTIKSRFHPLITEARTHYLDKTWTRTAPGALALILLLDQFPRNAYRGTGPAFASDAHALKIATRAVAKGFDRTYGNDVYRRLFFYQPLSHAEDLMAQVAGVALMENLHSSCAGSERAFLESHLGSFRRHCDVILRMGRFPGRNFALGRACTVDEIRFLRENPGGW
ncbi:hypothetical protein GGS21DRAFT_545023 [Xylaria nigripes]|nr:hypothetical protein GGS21DRAFT_545023 [Xylaria nigripes]